MLLNIMYVSVILLNFLWLAENYDYLNKHPDKRTKFKIFEVATRLVTMLMCTLAIILNIQNDSDIVERCVILVLAGVTCIMNGCCVIVVTRDMIKKNSDK